MRREACSKEDPGSLSGWQCPGEAGKVQCPGGGGGIA